MKTSMRSGLQRSRRQRPRQRRGSTFRLGGERMEPRAMLAVVTWDPESESLTEVIDSVWTQPGDHVVQLPAYDLTNGWYGNGWQTNEIMWEWAGDLNAGLNPNRQATTITIQGAGAGVTWLGSSSATGKGSIVQNGWNRVNAVNMTGIKFKDLSIANLANTSIFGLLNNGVGVAHDITFENCHVYLGSGVLQGRTCEVGGGYGAGDPGTFHFVNSVLAITNNRICVQWHRAAGQPDEAWALFDVDSRIAKYTGTFSGGDPAAYSIDNYDPDLVDVGDLYFQQEMGDSFDPYRYGFTNDQFASFSGGEYFLTSLTGPGATGWDGGTPVSEGPTIDVTGTLAGVSTTYGTASGSTTVTVSGSSLTANVIATAPAGFEVSSDGVTFGSTATFVRTGNAAGGTLSVRLAATAGAGTHSGDVTLSSTGATSVTVAIPSSTVSPKALTVRADSLTKFVGAANPTLTATVMGFVNGDTAATAVTGAASLSTTAVAGSPAGSYPITVGAGTLAAVNGNYTFGTLVNGTLTVTSAAVRVKGVYVRGNAWNSTYLALPAFTTSGTARLGWQLRDGAGQLATSGSGAAQVSWSNVNRILVRFDQPVAAPAAGALQLISGATGQTVSSTAATVVSGTDVAGTVVQFTVPTLQTGRYIASIAATAIRDSSQTTWLDGEWTTSSTTFATGSGDGTAGGAFNFSFNVLVGDVNTNGSINTQDRSAVVAQLFKTMTGTNYRANVDGNGAINATDYAPVASNMFKVLGSTPFVPPLMAASINAPTAVNLTSSAARLGGTVTADGGEPVLERGVVVLAGSSGIPMVGDASAIMLTAAGGVGGFAIDVAGLSPGTTYRFRGFVRTSVGIVYTEIATFSTLAGG